MLVAVRNTNLGSRDELLLVDMEIKHPTERLDERTQNKRM